MIKRMDEAERFVRDAMSFAHLQVSPQQTRFGVRQTLSSFWQRLRRKHRGDGDIPVGARMPSPRRPPRRRAAVELELP